jgi:uncharacterized protein (DUF305 family)
MTPIAVRLATVLAAVTAGLFLVSCTSPAADGHTDHEHGTASEVSADHGGASGATGQAEADHNADDVTFAANMIPHHRQAVEMAALVPGRSTDSALATLASEIAAAQEPEIRTMEGFLVQWGARPDANAGHGGHGMTMPGMVDDATMARLRSLSGTEFGTLWLESMIGHHQGAIEMAKAELANGTNADAIALARTIIETQQAEIGQMKQMLGGG